MAFTGILVVFHIKAWLGNNIGQNERACILGFSRDRELRMCMWGEEGSRGRTELG